MSATDILQGIPAVDDADFHRYQTMVLAETGIHLADGKRGLLTGRLARRLRDLAVGDWRRYYERVRVDSAERVRMIDLLLTNETSFFREPDQFTFITRSLVSTWLAEVKQKKRKPSLKIWSAGCSTGEEAYSLAMVLHDTLPGWSIDILGSDLSTTALEHAETGIWPIAKAAPIPEDLLRRYMLRGVDANAGLIKIDPTIRALVRFRRINLNEPSQSPSGPFDLLLCRNVLIYFDAGARRRAIERLIAACAPEGYLFVGHAETLQGFAGVRNVQPMIWRRSP